MNSLTKFSLLLIALFSFSTYAQKTVSVGIKAGFPNIVGGNAEVLLPILDQ